MNWEIGITVKGKPLYNCRWRFDGDLNITDYFQSAIRYDWLFHLHKRNVIESISDLVDVVIQSRLLRSELEESNKYDIDRQNIRKLNLFISFMENQILHTCRLIKTLEPKSKAKWYVYSVFLE